MRIGEAAAKAGVEASAIRFYEGSGVLPEPERTDSGYRVYHDDQVDLIRFVKRARSLGIPLDDVRQIVDLRTQGHAPCDVVRTVIAREATDIETRITELQGLRQELLRLQALADEVTDDWPAGSCVCHIVESSVSKN
ncbi:MAG: MerR family transcriptional regulator [Acidobacteria bacterium]|nr:MerR family transcriptional regulator [Acidobacteriota bacterium]